MYGFNPFNKIISDIDGKDLLILKDISEGWYIEYKQENIDIKDYAKHMSAFANQFGGMFFIGIKESADGTRKADSFSGIEKSSASEVSLRIREAASSHINPPLYYEEKIIDGPINEIGLQENKSIIIIGIPEGINPPYIHSSGKIYRRQSDQSKPENDRNALDHLFGKGKPYKESINRFINSNIDMPDAQKNTTWLYVNFIPEIENSRFPDNVSFENFKKIFIQQDGVSGTHIKMQSAYRTNKGYFARYIPEDTDPSLKLLSVHWMHNNRFQFSIPLNSYRLESQSNILSKYKYLSQYIDIANNQKYGDLNFIDLSYAFVVLTGIYNQICHFMRLCGVTNNYLYAYTITNTHFKSPFIDTKKFIDNISKNYIPVIEDSEIKYPHTYYSNNELLKLIKYDGKDDEKDINGEAYLHALGICYEILLSFGVFYDDAMDFITDPEFYDTPRN